MDEIWNDINLISSLHRPNAAAPANTASAFEFQDILSRPSPSFTKFNPKHPATALNLTSGSPNATTNRHRKQDKAVCNIKRPAPEIDPEDHSADGRFKRLIKNRESAARSRERKHAYTYELELELARLKKENAKLRKQQMLSLPSSPPPSQQLPEKATLRRTLTAPF